MINNKTKKSLLVILDGWGIGPNPKVDALASADTPFYDHLINTAPNSTLITHSHYVGLPDGQMGNSEVGHMNIGAGRTVFQDLLKINRAIENDTLKKEQVLNDAIDYAVENNKDFHLIGLLSDGGVHSHINHLFALIDILEASQINNIFVHVFTDGRDTSPKGGIVYLDQLLQHIEGKKTKIASVIGRYYAMDRDNRWERIKLAYDLLVNNEGEKVVDLKACIDKRYTTGETDEFIQPICLTDKGGQPIGRIKEKDPVLFFNYRADRPRQLTSMLVENDIPSVGTKKMDLYFISMTIYSEEFKNVHVIFPKKPLENTFGEIIEQNKLSQLRIAETEKYPHVTYFFSGGREKTFINEHRILVNSPKVATYDLQPEMSAQEITDKLLEFIPENNPDFICLNYANTDMVGHTGDFSAAIIAAETVDKCLARLIPFARKANYEIIIIADHGNSDYMINEDGSPNTAHTTNPVPCIYVGSLQNVELIDGILPDIAPTLAYLMNIETPDAMTGKILIKKLNDAVV